MRLVRHIWKQAPAFALLLLFVSGWLAVPVSLAAPEPIMCGMVCCEESGECCCFTSRQEHQHADGEGEEDAQLLAWRKECPSNCATQASFNLHSLINKPLPQMLRHSLSDAAERLTYRAVRGHRFTLSRDSIPRAPPLFS